MKTLVIRAESSMDQGAGHVMRCLALAQEWREQQGRVIFLSSDELPWVADRLDKEKMERQKIPCPAGSETDAGTTGSFCRSLGGSALVLDGYWFDRAFLSRLGDLNPLVVDDLADRDLTGAGWILNPNCHATPHLYDGKCGPETQLLLGSRYAPIRREFLAHRDMAGNLQSILKHVVITLGGGETAGVASQILNILASLLPENTTFTVLAADGKTSPAMASPIHRLGARLRLLTSAENMPELLSSADLVVSGAGGTCWETCLLGRPAIVILLAANQELVAAALEAEEAALIVDYRAPGFETNFEAAVKQLTPDRLRTMGARAAGLVDGLGARRVAETLL